MKTGAKAVVIIIGIIVAGYLLLWITGLDRYAKVIFWRTVTPEKSLERFEHGRYGGWSWTPDGRIMYSKVISKVSHVKGMGHLGYSQEGNETQICIINKDGTGNTILKKIPWMSKRQKQVKRVKELEKTMKATKGKRWDRVYEESRTGKLDKEIYPDPALAHIGWLDWNKNNNKLVFIANDGTGKMGIAISDPEFKDVEWVNFTKSDEILGDTCWSPDGTKIAYLNRGYVRIIELKDLRQYQITGNYCSGLAWMPDGKGIITLSNKKEDDGIVIMNLKGNVIKNIGGGGRPSISPDGEWVVYSQGIINLKTGEKRRFTHDLGFPKFSPDGKHIIEGWEGGIHILDFENNLVKNLRSLNPNESGGESVIAAFKEGQ